MSPRQKTVADPPVHPAADVFPMLPEDELAELAEDIRAHGLLHPIVLDQEGVLIDGRNRLAACRLAGVEPQFHQQHVLDPIAFILSENVHRRHLTEGQRAIAVVRAACFNLKQDQETQRSLAGEHNVNSGRIGQAAVIVEHAPDLADQVMAKTLAFSVAYQKAKERREEHDSRELAVARAKANLARIRSEGADLFSLVEEERITVSEAVTILDKRAKEEHDRRVRETRYFIESSMMLRSRLWSDPDTILDEWIDDVNEHQQRGPFAEQVWSPDGLHALGHDLIALGEAMAARKED